MSREEFPGNFEQDTREHELTILRDEGLFKHLRYRKPGTGVYGFDILTWPGHLCYTGDMGTYVFRRVPDMLEFFRRPDSREKYRFSVDYWAEKAIAVDKHSGLKKWCPEKFREQVTEYFRQHTFRDKYTEKLVWGEVEDQILHFADNECEALSALYDFEEQGFSFSDWDYRDGKAWDYGFLWCCHALEWAVEKYDARKAEGAKVESQRRNRLRHV